MKKKRFKLKVEAYNPGSNPTNRHISVLLEALQLHIKTSKSKREAFDKQL